ncbi:hypothetical protein PR202_ga07087 [Eleusine coracana subsp. coracana]|uniref:Uncharacterized protein n=1 Tax=Eleusine coracana subsp. coracana TaxID=191504 RepID=A0AAV5BXL5_ELECO|nr:hypothetical protein PR202_ga07087 [Eleusine coracana subsp. coracana]
MDQQQQQQQVPSGKVIREQAAQARSREFGELMSTGHHYGTTTQAPTRDQVADISNHRTCSQRYWPIRESRGTLQPDNRLLPLLLLPLPVLLPVLLLVPIPIPISLPSPSSSHFPSPSPSSSSSSSSCSCSCSSSSSDSS